MGAGSERVGKRPTRSLSAAEIVWKASYHWIRVTRADNQEARHLFERAVKAGFERREHGSFFALADTPEDAVGICELP